MLTHHPSLKTNRFLSICDHIYHLVTFFIQISNRKQKHKKKMQSSIKHVNLYFQHRFFKKPREFKFKKQMSGFFFKCKYNTYTWMQIKKENKFFISYKIP